MTVTQTLRAHVTTPELTYRGHELSIDEGAHVAYVIDRQTGQSVLELHEAEWAVLNREEWRVEGVTPEGARSIWNASRACGRCGASVFPTPEYAMPK
jgi:hypothetical protein